VHAPIAPETGIAVARETGRELPPLDPGEASEDEARLAIADAPPAEVRAEDAEASVPIDPRGDARATALVLAAAIDPDCFHVASFDVQARAIARTVSPETARDLARLASDLRVTAAERVAAAAILRHVPDGEIALPGAAVLVLRDAWDARASDPTLAAAAVGSLAVFGNTGDRRALLDESSTSSASAALARAGLSAARGDAAAFEIAAASVEGRDPRRSEIAISALTAIASSGDGALSDAGRARCAETLSRALTGRAPTDPSSARLLSALAAVDARRAEPLLVATIADASTSDAGAQSVASALAADRSRSANAGASLEKLLGDAHLSDRRRALVAGTLLRARDR
jgi:hypothetical protein